MNQNCTERVQLKCQNPPCPCQVCTDLRDTGRDDQGSCGELANDGSASNRNFVNFITEAMGVIAFFTIATIMFWFAVSRNACCAVVRIYQSGRNTQIVALTALGLLILLISLTLIQHKVQHTIRHAKAVKQTKAAAEPYVIQPKKGDKISLVPIKPEVFIRLDLANNCTMTKNITITITDGQSRPIFKQSKLFEIPLEMKHPPAILVYLKDVILKRY